MAPQPHIQGRTCTGELALETGHLWGALVGGNPTKPQKKTILSFNSSRKIVLFQGAAFFPQTVENPAFTQNSDLHWQNPDLHWKRDRVSTCPYSMYGLLQPIFPKWFELVLLKHVQTISHGSPPFVGGTLCGRKNALLSTLSSKKSITFGMILRS